MYKIEVKRAKGKQWYWVLKARNGKVLATSERYMRQPLRLVSRLAADLNKGCQGMCYVAVEK